MSPLPGDTATPLNPSEQAQWDDAQKALDALASSLLAGDASELQTSLEAIKQPSLDLTRILNALHVPPDADPTQKDGLLRILRRIPDGWGRWIGCSKGWYPLLINTDQALSALDPDYEIHQVKEKYGTLRFYYGASLPYDSPVHRQMDAIASQAEAQSALTCESCGNPGMTMQAGGWYATKCYICAALTSQGYRPYRISEDHPDAVLLDLTVCLPDPALEPAPFDLSLTQSEVDENDLEFQKASLARQAAYQHQRAFEKRLESLLDLGVDQENGYSRAYNGADAPNLRYTYLLHDEVAARAALDRLLATSDRDLGAKVVSTALRFPPIPLTLTYPDPISLQLNMEPTPLPERATFARWLTTSLSLLEDNLLDYTDLPNGSAQWTFLLPSTAVAETAISSLRDTLTQLGATATLRLATIGNPPQEVASPEIDFLP